MSEFSFKKPSIREIEDYLTEKSGRKIRLGGNFFEVFQTKVKITIQDNETDYYLSFQEAQDACFHQKNINVYYENLLIQLNKYLILFKENVRIK